MQQLDDSTAATSELSSNAEERPDLTDKGKKRYMYIYTYKDSRTHLWSQENYKNWTVATRFH